jgi:hypothetical protein
MARDLRVTGTPVPANEQSRADAAESLQRMTARSQDILFSASTVFPFDLFPDQIVLDRSQLTITHRWFFWLGNVTSVRIEDIINVNVNAGPFFGSVQVAVRFLDVLDTMNTIRPTHINWLPRAKAMQLKVILQGLLIAANKQIDLTGLDTRELVEQLSELGASSPTEAP